jgi:hypothetical protein
MQDHAEIDKPNSRRAGIARMIPQTARNTSSNRFETRGVVPCLAESPWVRS